ncbi:MAG: UDP-N-acetylmuramoyl-L-alanyl-D-glutamate--2,6-diaminopimelate ligase, partial [Chloroflexi bacterium]|nr:UDP-N-acetylmuramoyl-L-alanyl-D-glutamate--2,6-diaminopimelate ligase [Chloroflexota bacterium]
MKLLLLVRALPQHEIQNPRDIDITRITADSRQVIPGALFVAIPGEKFDGARFIPEAIATGAVAIVVQSLVSGVQSPISN